MRVTGWHVDGFGLFADHKVEDLPAGLTVIHGPNEAGKTTLISFILGVLFGFKGGKKTPQYEPLRGGRHGGRVFIDGTDGQYIVERYKQGNKLTATLPDGAVGTADDLRALLGHADQGLFRNIFAFSLHELESLATLQDEAVKERIFAAPALGAGRSPREVLKQLDGREKALLKPRASSTVRDLLRRLRDNQRSLRSARNLALSYPKAVSELAEVENKVLGIKSELTEVRTEVSRYEALIAAWLEWSRLVDEKEDLAKLEVPDGVSPEVENRLVQIREQIKERTGKVEAAEEELEDLKRRMERVSVDDRLLAIANRGKELYAGAGSYTSDLARFRELDADVETKHNQVSEKVAALGPGWSKARVEEFDTSIPATADIGEWRKKFEKAREDRRNSQSKVEELRRRVAELKDERERKLEELDRSGIRSTLEQIDAEERSLQRLRSLLATKTRMGDRVGSTETLLKERKRAFEEASSAPPLGVPTVALAGIIAALAVASAALFLAAQAPAGAGVLLVVFLLGGLWLVSNAARKRTVRSKADALEDARRDVTQLEDELESVEQEASDSAAAFGFDTVRTFDDIDGHLSRIGQERLKRAKADDIRGALDDLEQRLRSLERDLNEAEDDLGRRETEQDALQEAWQSWRSQRGVPEDLSPEVALELFPAIRAAKDAIADLEAAEGQRADLEQLVGEYEQEAAEVLSAAGMPPAARGSALVAAVDRLYRAIQDDEVKRRDISNMTKGLDAAQRKVDERKRDFEDAVQARQEIFDGLGVGTEQEVLDVVEALKKRLDLEKTVEDRERGIKALIGKGTEANVRYELLEAGELPEWEERLALAKEGLQGLETAHEAAVERRNEARARVTEIEEFADIAALEIEAESLRTQLYAAIREWKKVVLARVLIERTLARFEEEHQPQVVDRAAKLFEHITGGKYQRLVAGEDALVAVTNDRARIDLVDLSTGTVQQLYLCLRLALAEEFAARGTVLPLFMDDVLVNFDPERAEQVAGIIAEVSEQRQVLLFTCHPETRDLARTADPDARVIELERFAG